MDYKTKRKAQVAFRNMQRFSSFCFRANKLLGNKETLQDEKIQILKEFSSFFITNDNDFSLRVARTILEDPIISSGPDFAIFLPAVLEALSQIETTSEEFKGYLSSHLYITITNFEAMAAISNRFEANHNDYFDEVGTEKLNLLCVSVKAYVNDFYNKTGVVTVLLGNILLKND